MLPQVENLIPRPRDISESMDYFFPWSTATTSSPTCCSLCSNWSNHQTLDINLDLDNPKYVWRQTPLDLTRDSHKQHKQQLKTWLGFFLLYLRQNIKPYTSYRLGLRWKNRQKNILHELRLIEPCKKWIVIFCNYLIPTLQ